VTSFHRLRRRARRRLALQCSAHAASAGRRCPAITMYRTKLRLPYWAAPSRTCGVALYADSPSARVLRRAPRLSGRSLLARYNVELARGVLLDAESLTVTARGGWRDIFRAVKAARLMYVVR